MPPRRTEAIGLGENIAVLIDNLHILRLQTLNRGRNEVNIPPTCSSASGVPRRSFSATDAFAGCCSLSKTLS